MPIDKGGTLTESKHKCQINISREQTINQKKSITSKSKKVPKDIIQIDNIKKSKSKKVPKDVSNDEANFVVNNNDNKTSINNTASCDKLSKIDFVNEKYKNQQKIHKTIKISLKTIIKSDQYLRIIN